MEGCAYILFQYYLILYNGLQDLRIWISKDRMCSGNSPQCCESSYLVPRNCIQWSKKGTGLPNSFIKYASVQIFFQMDTFSVSSHFTYGCNFILCHYDLSQPHVHHCHPTSRPGWIWLIHPLAIKLFLSCPSQLLLTIGG